MDTVAAMVAERSRGSLSARILCVGIASTACPAAFLPRGFHLVAVPPAELGRVLDLSRFSLPRLISRSFGTRFRQFNC